MNNDQSELGIVFKKYIVNTAPKSRVVVRKIILCKLSKRVYGLLKNSKGASQREVCISTKVLKHIFDDHKIYYPEIIEFLDLFVRLPHRIYRNKLGKSGSLLLIRELHTREYCTVLDLVSSHGTNYLEVRTCFRMANPENYLRTVECIWRK